MKRRRLYGGGTLVVLVVAVVLWRNPFGARTRLADVISRGARTAGAAAATPLPPPAGPLRFRSVVVDAKFHGDCKAVGDLDGDGRPDLVVGGKGGLAFFTAPRDAAKGRWVRHEIAKATIEFTTDMQLGDVDRDGDLDVLVPDGDKGNNVLWFENPQKETKPGGKGTWLRHEIGANGDWAHDLEVADLDGDGKLDVVVRQGRTTIFFQDQPDSWQKLSIETKGRGGTAIADLDGDGRPDLVQNGYWLRNPGARAKVWARHEIAPGWPEDVGVTVGDVNRDGRLDVLLSPAEVQGRLAWYEASYTFPKSRDAAWTEHVIAKDVAFVHTFKLEDMNDDGALDVVFAEMAQAPKKRVGILYSRKNGQAFDLQVLSTRGSHNVRVADFDGNGRPDVAGANWQGPPVEAWMNEGPDGLGAWQYLEIDGSRDERAFGLTFPRRAQGHDIVAGSVHYENPGGDLGGPWKRTVLPRPLDVMWSLDERAQPPGALPPLVGEALGKVYWLEPKAGGFGKHVAAAGFTPTEHTNSQGYLRAPLLRGPSPELVFTTGKGVFALQVPASLAEPWPSFRITGDETTEDGIAAADVDGDGWVDVAAAGGPKGNELAWWRNPGPGKVTAGPWQKAPLGEVEGWADRLVLADLDGDARPDLVVSVENGAAQGASTSWFRNPKEPAKGPWTRTPIALQGSTNALDVADMDADGHLDVITGEHRGAQRVTVWRNLGRARGFAPHVVDEGKESHLGARAVDLDGDGDLDLVSIAWDGYAKLHVWRNDRIQSPGKGAPTAEASLPAP
ncbi:MAG: VCBS repeat-containing protein [Myxococcales bacterium]|nr:VCBS repeat-containing protein [Myxococcales bacterium]